MSRSSYCKYMLFHATMASFLIHAPLRDLSLGTWHFHLLGKSFLFERPLQKCLSRKSKLPSIPYHLWIHHNLLFDGLGWVVRCPSTSLREQKTARWSWLHWCSFALIKLYTYGYAVMQPPFSKNRWTTFKKWIDSPFSMFYRLMIDSACLPRVFKGTIFKFRIYILVA